MADTVHKLVIIGSGPAGLTAGVYAGRANLAPLIIDGEKPGGQLMGTSAVENWPGEISIMGPELMNRMRKQAEHNGCIFKSGTITSIETKKRPFTITTNKNETLKAHSVIIASGATPKRLQVPGEDMYWGKGVTTCAVCDGAFYKGLPVIIIGGGDTAMEDASFMTNFTDLITIVQIGPSLTACEAMKARVVNNPKIKIIYSSSVSEIKGDGKKVTEIVITNNKTKQQTTLTTSAVFVAIGLKPNTEFVQGTVKTAPNGYLILSDMTKTSVEGIFGAGDVADARYRQAVTSAGHGCMAALDAEKYLKDMGI